ncbi:MAG TPA: class I SAM-dependent methyltransferase [Solirubrobacteraceae bacterium]
MRTLSDAAVWHDLECGRYAADLPYWRRLAAAHGGPVLDLGAGTGRVSIDLARQGHEVTALDHDQELLSELARRAVRERARVTPALGDARDFSLGETFPLIVIPMQTIQLLRAAGRARLLSCAAEHLAAGGRLAAAITEHFDLYDAAAQPPDLLPEPDVLEASGTVYVSQPTAVTQAHDVFILERRRERLSPGTERVVEVHRERLDSLTAAQLERDGIEAGLRPAGRTEIGPTPDHVGSVVVMLDA